jgi:hypothetical protein
MPLSWRGLSRDALLQLPKTGGAMRTGGFMLNTAQVLVKACEARHCGGSIHGTAMLYTNIHSRLKIRPAMSHALLRRIAECRRRSSKARTHAEKIAIAATIPLSKP